ncbi:methylenetetrahydrofolate--tRNA-(uracil(54)-C(5))-methyltransferase (FADH(2)-oxidizing) TrmFO [Flavobacteriaceae bacterium]|nr:methylenetetrahydrofolate--tRNA-(uracil(54)-C(5))-methyltransferase (FADH(2)-oxidizing) TrmFO [Flavobacteriaceae bacterium]
MAKRVNIIGGGLAGCESAWQLASRGIEVNLYELRNGKKTSAAHKTDYLAELVCSNSLRNDDINSAIGLLHQEMRMLGSLIISVADEHQVPAGSALAVDRDAFSLEIQEKISSHPNIKLIREEVKSIDPDQITIIATGPLTSDALSEEIIKITDKSKLFFFDALSPIIHRDTIDFSKCWFQSRYDKKGPSGTGKDYINCPMNKEQYYELCQEIMDGEKTDFKEWEKSTPYFEGCLPIEVMISRGVETLRFGPLKPVGLTNPHDVVEKPYAVVQLRQDNKAGSLFNIVGFQTKLKYQEQDRIFRKIPALEKVEFARFGGIHRNSFINSPKLLDKFLRLKNNPNIRFAGQITGVEGYVESAAMGLICGLITVAEIEGQELSSPDSKTAIGSLLNYITNDHVDDGVKSFQPMNVNFGLIESLAERVKKHLRKEQYSKRAILTMEGWIKNNKFLNFRE